MPRISVSEELPAPFPGIETMDDSKAHQALTTLATVIEEVGTGFLVVVTGAGVSVARGRRTRVSADRRGITPRFDRTIPTTDCLG